MNLENIILKSVFIEERRKGGVYRAKASERSGDRLAEWKELLNVAEDRTIFEKRLRAGEIIEKEALDICGDCIVTGDPEIPPWARILSDIMELLPLRVEDAESCTVLRREDLSLTGPVRSLFPFVQYCESIWKKQNDSSSLSFNTGDPAAGIADRLPLTDLSRMVLNRLYQAVYQTFNTKARFMTLMGHKTEGLWEKMERELLSGGWEKLFEEYPVLARRMGTVIVQYLAFIEEFHLRFLEKKSVLEREFFGGGSICRIVKLEGEISDLHQDEDAYCYCPSTETEACVQTRSLESTSAGEHRLIISGMRTI